jgi:hypothetical protein
MSQLLSTVKIRKLFIFHTIAIVINIIVVMTENRIPRTVPEILFGISIIIPAIGPKMSKLGPNANIDE